MCLATHVRKHLQGSVVAIHGHDRRGMDEGTFRRVESRNHLSVTQIDTNMAIAVLEHNVTRLRVTGDLELVAIA